MSITTITQAIQGIREWYGNLNSATLTGAIDVIVVEQEDGTFLSSPFHVRFGKLGVLKAKEKIVDIEINDEPVNIHMKLDDAGAAFFVEGVADEEVFFPPELATSPIPNTYFPPRWESKEKGDKLTSSVNRSLMEAFDEETNENESSASNSSEPETRSSYKRKHPERTRLQPDEGAMEEGLADVLDSEVHAKEGEIDVAIQTDLNSNRGKLNRKKRKRRSMNLKHTRSGSKSSSKDIDAESDFEKSEVQCSDDIFPMDDVNDDQEVDMGSTPTPTHHAILDLKVGAGSSIKSGINFASTSVPSTPVAIVSPMLKDETPTPSHPGHSSSMPGLEQINAYIAESNVEDSTSSIDIKAIQSPPSVNENSFLSARLPDQQQLDSMFSKPEVDGSDDSDEVNKKIPPTRINQVQYFSEPEHSSTTTPIGSRPGSPIMSDSEIMSSESSELRKAREDQGKERGEQSWEWGQLPSTTTTPAQDKARKASTDQQNGIKLEESKTTNATEDSRWTFLWFRGRSESTNKRPKDEEKSSKKDENKEDKTLPGVTLESLKTDEEIQKYIGAHFHGVAKSPPLTTGRAISYGQIDSDTESGNGPSLPMSPHSVEGAIGGGSQYDADEGYSRRFRVLKDIDVSLCGGLNKGQGFSPKLFELRKLAFDDFVMELNKGSNIFENQDLVVKMGEQYYDWKTACPIIMSTILYGRPLPTDMLEEIGRSLQTCPKHPETNSGLEESTTTLNVETTASEQRKNSSWWPFGSKGDAEGPPTEGVLSGSPGRDIAAAFAAVAGAPETNECDRKLITTSTTDIKIEPNADTSDKAVQISQTDDQVDNKSQQFINEHETMEILSNNNVKLSEHLEDDKSKSVVVDIDVNNSTDIVNTHGAERISSSAQTGESLPRTPPRISRGDVNVSTSSDTSNNDDVLRRENIFGKFKKTLRLSTESIRALNLRPGSNEVQFSVTTAYQGTTRCRCHLYLWKSTDKIVISDIDGTITKSDVLGHILPIIGKDWAQSGVASLFTKIVNNGYHIAYLSARSIGHAAVTKDYLKSVNQGDMNLPDGPLLLNPTSLVSALHREVIIKKPEEFKIACLRDIQKLFPENPFYAGYGNRTNDVFAYRAVGIPISRIFTINSKGELRHELTQTFQTSYCNQSTMVDHIFPPSTGANGYVNSSNTLIYSTFTYWREPLAEVTLFLEDETKKSDTSSQKAITTTAETEISTTGSSNI